MLKEELSEQARIEEEREHASELERQLREQALISRSLDEQIATAEADVAEKNAELERLTSQSKLQEMQRRVCQTQRDDVFQKHSELRAAYSSHVQSIFEMTLEQERFTVENEFLVKKNENLQTQKETLSKSLLESQKLFDKEKLLFTELAQKVSDQKESIGNVDKNSRTLTFTIQKTARLIDGMEKMCANLSKISAQSETLQESEKDTLRFEKELFELKKSLAKEQEDAVLQESEYSAMQEVKKRLEGEVEKMRLRKSEMTLSKSGLKREIKHNQRSRLVLDLDPDQNYATLPIKPQRNKTHEDELDLSCVRNEPPHLRHLKSRDNVEGSVISQEFSLRPEHSVDNSVFSSNRFIFPQHAPGMERLYSTNNPQGSSPKSSKDYSSFVPRDLVGDDNEDRKELRAFWQKIIKELARILSLFIKSSANIAETASAASTRISTSDKNTQQLRSLFGKFGNKSFEGFR